MTNETLSSTVQSLLADKVQALTETRDKMVCVTVAPENLYAFMQQLRDTQGFNFLTDVCGVHLHEAQPELLGCVYHLHNLVANVRLRVKTFVPKTDPKVPSMVPLWKSANWQERETFDFYGIEFTGHPDLRRILNVDEMDFFPLRKEYPLEEQTRTDKNDYMFGR
jgi:NADH-quinone oxidoreductase subunit C